MTVNWSQTLIKMRELHIPIKKVLSTYENSNC